LHRRDRRDNNKLNIEQYGIILTELSKTHKDLSYRQLDKLVFRVTNI